ncbi:sugar O-acetyltransferase [Sporolactobacillus shoreicorticis]|uniref:Acetyltransferase n=1 Tax=Sporolactobacillus shoreicorticis TaxID=1923877 RepID=A0ABW5S4B4_9BACL|nr:sugar O-acetyltransferase [Sporolactobacillus shoreicorticis]MCO7124484.1 sugar O-acetyltransferase [Sporolactobacillus shoreicorticis]
MAGDQLDNMLNGHLYHQTNELLEIRFKARDLLYEYNHCHPRNLEKRSQIIENLFGATGKHFFVEIPFHCDYGFNIEIGENFFCNNNCTLLDCNRITIGDNVLFAPNVGIYTAGHCIDPELRLNKQEYTAPVHIGDNVWIGANASVLPGVSIGTNVVIGAGSVVTHDIPDNCVAVGNPCRVLRYVNEHDKKYYFRDRKV